MATIAKLVCPVLHSVVPRERLFALMDRLRTRRLMWVCGPPGAGKTSLVASYTAANRRRCIWMQVDRGDQDLSTFFYYLSQAAQRVIGRRARNLPLLSSEYRADLVAYVRHFFRRLSACLNSEDFIVLDNYHELLEDSPLHELLPVGIEELSSNISVCIISRLEAPPSYARMDAAEDLGRIGWTDLKLTLAEAESIVAVHGALSTTDTRQLFAQSGGWIAGLTLIRHRIEQLGGASSDTPIGALDNVFNYFAGQIFSIAAPDTRDFLIKTALFPRMTIRMAEALTGNRRASSILDFLYHRQMFTECHSSYFQYHDLFRAFLLDQLQKTFTVQGQNELRSRAAHILEDVGLTEAAADLHIAAGNDAALSTLVLNSASKLITLGRTDTVRYWIEALPDSRVNSNGWLLYLYGMAELQRDPIRARGPLERGHSRFVDARDEHGQRLACAAIVFSFWLEFSNFRPMDRWVDRLIDLTSDDTASPDASQDLYVQTAMVFGVIYRRPHPAHWNRVSERLESLLQMDLPADERVSAACIFIQALFSVGEMDRAERVVSACRPLVDRGSVSPMHRVLWWTQVGWVHWFSGRTKKAHQAFELALRQVEDNAIGLPALKTYPLIGLSCCAIDFGDPDAAEHYCDRAMAHGDSGRVLDAVFTSRMRCLIAMHRGDWSRAAAMADQSVARAADASVWWEFNNRVLSAFLYTEMGQTDSASVQLLRADELVRGTVYDRCRCELNLLRGYAELRQGRQKACHPFLREALYEWSRQAYHHHVRTFPGVYSMMYAEAVATSTEMPFARRVIQNLELRAPASAPESWPWGLKIFTLGRFAILEHGVPLQFPRKVPKKPLQVLKALIAYGGQDVPERRLVDALWPRDEGDYAHNSFSVALTRLRRLLRVPDAIRQRAGCLSINQEVVWIDCTHFERALTEAMATGSSEQESLSEALNRYTGPFLEEEGELPWTVSLRERLRTKFVRGAGALGRIQMLANELPAAIATFERAIDTDPLMEEFYRELIRCYGRAGQVAEAMSVYRRLRRTLAAVLNVEPAEPTEALIAALGRTDPIGRQRAS